MLRNVITRHCLHYSEVFKPLNYEKSSNTTNSSEETNTAPNSLSHSCLENIYLIEEWKGVLKIGVHIFSKCIIYIFVYLIGLHVHLLLIKLSPPN